MEQIAVERRGGIPWWVWAIVALIIVAIIWYFASGGTSNSAAGQEPATNTGEASRAQTAQITDLAVLYNPTEAANVAGQTVETQPVRVLSVTGDQSFWVGQGVGQQVLVILNEKPTPNQPATEGRYDVNPGEMVRIYGTVQRFPGYEAARQQWKVNPDARSELEKQTVYIAADRLDITSRP